MLGLRFGICIGMVAASSWAAAPIKTERPDGTPNRAAWMAQGSFGLMTHYLPQPPQGTKEERQAWVDRTAEAFDLKGFMRQFDETGADWLIFTLTQNNCVLNSANPKLPEGSTYLTARRDILMELARQLHERKKRLILYLPSDSEPSVRGYLQAPGDYWPQYLSFVQSFSDTFGPLCDGWWFDSCGAKSDDQWKVWLDACRSGNPASAVAFSGAEFCASGGQVNPRCPIEDYHAGEIHLLDDGKIRTDFVYPPGEDIIVTPKGKLQKRGQEAKVYMPSSQFIGNVQWHCLLPIDLTFNPAVPNQYCHYTDKELFQFVDDVKAVGGAITINVPIDLANGHIPQDTQAQLVRLGNHVQANGK